MSKRTISKTFGTNGRLLENPRLPPEAITEALEPNEKQLKEALAKQRAEKQTKAEQDLAKALSEWSEKWAADLRPKVSIDGSEISHQLRVVLR